MAEDGFAFFDTTIGSCAVAWTELGICALQLPEATEEATRARLLRRRAGLVPRTPPAHVRHIIDKVVALLEGARVGFADAAVDLRQARAFERAVYAITVEIPPGQTLTYGEVAGRLGGRALSRSVGQALGRNPVPIIVPCHRVVAANGRTGGFSAPGGIATKLRLLAIESVHGTPGTLPF